VQSCPRRRAGVARDERTTDAVGNSCQILWIGVRRPQIVRKNLHFIDVANDEKAGLLIELGARAVVRDFVDLPRFMNALEIE
jgi:hypothetical protein